MTLSSGSKESGPVVLTSYEIATLKLRADLVVLSSCESSVGQDTGAEGVLGLTRAFLIAGARCVCGSLWPVEDVATERLMKTFYQRKLSQGLGTGSGASGS